MAVVVQPRSRVRQPWGSIVLGHGTGPITRNSDNATDNTIAKLAGVIVPGGTMNENSLIRVWSMWSYTNSASTKTLIPRWAGGSMGQTGLTTTQTASLTNIVWAYNSLTNQRAFNNTAAMGANSGNALLTYAVDTRNDQEVSFNCQWGANVVGESITLEQYLVELFF